jgi:hypothetical protein
MLFLCVSDSNIYGYAPWLVKHFNNGYIYITNPFNPNFSTRRVNPNTNQYDIILPEDAFKVKEDLILLKTKKQGIDPKYKDINKLFYSDIKEAVKKFKIKAGIINDLEIEGANLLYHNQTYRIYQVVGTHNARTLNMFGNNTEWCTKYSDAANYYLSQGAVYVILKNNTPFIQFHFNPNVVDSESGWDYPIQVMDVDDVRVDINSLDSNLIDGLKQIINNANNYQTTMDIAMCFNLKIKAENIINFIPSNPQDALIFFRNFWGLSGNYHITDNDSELIVKHACESYIKDDFKYLGIYIDEFYLWIHYPPHRLIYLEDIILNNKKLFMTYFTVLYSPGTPRPYEFRDTLTQHMRNKIDSGEWNFEN